MFPHFIGVIARNNTIHDGFQNFQMSTNHNTIFYNFNMRNFPVGDARRKP